MYPFPSKTQEQNQHERQREFTMAMAPAAWHSLLSLASTSLSSCPNLHSQLSAPPRSRIISTHHPSTLPPLALPPDVLFNSIIHINNTTKLPSCAPPPANLGFTLLSNYQ